MERMPILRLENILKVFPGVVALDHVDFDLYPGEVHALVGENGAGKSTLIKIIAGVYQPNGGTINVDGEPVQFEKPGDALAQGIKVVYQELDLVPALSVAENVFLGEYPHSRFGTVDWRQLRADTREVLNRLGLDIDPGIRVNKLRVAEQQLVEIARALSSDAKVIIMDEPTSALSPGEAASLFEIIERLREQGVGLIYVSHKLEEIFEIADRVTVLRDGERVATKPVQETEHGQLITWMVGRKLQDFFPKTASKIGGPLLEVRNVNNDRLHDINFTISQGEVVGVFGLIGAGTHAIGHALFGGEEHSGDVILDGQLVTPGSPVDAIKKGMALLTEDRKEDGVVPLLSVKGNITLPALGRLTRFGWIKRRAEQQVAASYVEDLAIKTPSLNQAMRYLSGGNQQKALMARWLLLDQKLLILSEPTRGIDIGTKTEIYRLIDTMAQEGKGILLISTEMPEVLNIANRILVVSEGRITGEFTREEATNQNLMEAAIPRSALAVVGGTDEGDGI